MKKCRFKILAFFLTILIITQVFPFTVLAEAYDSTIVQSQGGSENYTEDAQILSEDTEKRDKYSKTYLRDDGAFTQLQSAFPLHYKKNGKWVDIDSTLISVKNENGEKVLTNTANDFKVELPERLSNASQIKIKQGSYGLSFSLDLNTKNNGKIVKHKSVKGKSKVKKMAELDQKSQSVIYKNVYKNTDLKYTVNPEGLKEELIVKKLPKQLANYVFVINCEGLSPQLQADRSVLFYAGEQVIFKIPSPIMYDNEGKISNDIHVLLESKESNKCVLTYTPSLEWLTNVDRTYPVIIDPEITIDTGSVVGNNMKDTGITSSDPDINFSESPLLSAFDFDGEKGHILFDYQYSMFNTRFNRPLTVTSAILSFKAGAVELGNFAVTAHRITSPWDIFKVTYNTRPEYDEKPIDFFLPSSSEDDQWKDLDLTEVFNGWSLGRYPNYGVQLNAQSGSQNGILFIANEAASDGPTLEITYRENNIGINNIDSYHSISANDAGTAYVNDTSQAFTLVRDEIGLDGNIMPVNIQRVFSPSGDSADNAYGSGWTINYAQTLSAQLINTDKELLIYKNETGAKHYLTYYGLTDDGRGEWRETSFGNSVNDEVVVYYDVGCTSYRNFHQATVKKGNQFLRFDTKGRLIKILDDSENKNYIEIKYADANSAKITEIIDGVGRRYVFNYSGGFLKLATLSSITCYAPDGSRISFTASDGTTQYAQVNYNYTVVDNRNSILKNIKYPDGRQIEFTVGDELMSAKSSYNDLLEISYNSDHIVNKMEKKVYNSATSSYIPTERLEIICIDNRNEKHFKDINGNIQIIQYDAHGKQLGSRSSGQSFGFSKYGADVKEAETPDVSTSPNLVLNGDFSQIEAWGKFENWEKPLPFGYTYKKASLYRSSPSSCLMAFCYRNTYWTSQSIEITDPGRYEASVYFNGSISGAIELKATVNGKSISTLSYSTEPVSDTNGEWLRKAVAFNVPEGAESVVISLGSDNELFGEICIDDVELHRIGSVKSELDDIESQILPYNYIKNPDFSRIGPTTNTADCWEYGASIGFRTSLPEDSTRDHTMDDYGYQLNGVPWSGNVLYQIVPINGKKGDYFSISGWSKSSNASPMRLDAERFWGIQVDVLKNGKYEPLTKAYYNNQVSGWQYTMNGFELEEDVTEVKVGLWYMCQTGQAFYDGIQLCKTVKSSGSGSPFESSCKCDGCQEKGCTCKCTSTCNCPQCKRQNTTVKNSNNQVEQAIRTDGKKQIINRTNYTADGNYIVQIHDSIDGNVSYEYDENSALITKQNEKDYTYNKSRQIAQVSQQADGLVNGSMVQNRYTYEKNMLTGVNRNGTDYHMTYTPFGSLSSWSVGNLQLLQNSYSNDHRQLKQNTQFANGQSIKYRYDGQHRLTGVSNDNGATWRYTVVYRDDGSGLVTDNFLHRQTAYSSDGLNVATVGSDGQLRFKVNTEENAVTHNMVNKIYRYEEKADGYDEASGQKTENSLFKSKSISDGVAMSKTTDFFDRMIQKKISSPGLKRQTSLTYADVSESETSRRVEVYQDAIQKASNNAIILNNQYGYAYQEDGKILSISKNGAPHSTYNYDVLGQLTAETLNGTSTTYKYDTGGNLRNKTTGNHTTEYTYNNNAWKDQLTAYNGKPITYDANGNPLTYDGWSFTWEAGQQLINMKKEDTSITFDYDENGQRIRKTIKIGDEVEQYEYFWYESRLVGQIKTKDGQIDTLYFFYDQEGRPAGFVENDGLPYFYQLNLQGDICAVVAPDGTLAAEYIYDAWGNIISQTGPIADLNPIRYRGYQYDTETGLYYLQSRYYNPEWCRFLTPDCLVNWNGPLMATNLYAYCQNDPVNLYDNTGTFGKDFHRHLSAFTAALYFDVRFAAVLGKSCADVDSVFPSNYIWDKYNQSWHFNIPSQQVDGKDSRNVRSEDMFNHGKEKLELAAKTANGAEKEQLLIAAMQDFGMGLHPLQDQISHSGEDGDLIATFNTFSFYYNGENIGINVSVYDLFHFHLFKIDKPDGMYYKGHTKGYVAREVTFEYMRSVYDLVCEKGLMEDMKMTDPFGQQLTVMLYFACYLIAYQ